MSYLFRLDCRANGFAPLNLSEEPLGFNSLKLTMKRSESYDGISGEFAFDLKFCGAGGDYIKRVYNEQGIFATEYFTIYLHKDARTTDNLILVGRVDLTKFRYDFDGVSVSIVPLADISSFINTLDREVDLFSQVCLGDSLPTLSLLPVVNNTLAGFDYSASTSFKANKDSLIGCYYQTRIEGADFTYEQYFSLPCDITVYDDMLIYDETNDPAANSNLVKINHTGTVDICVKGDWKLGFSGYNVFLANPGGCSGSDIGNGYSYWFRLYKNNVLIQDFGTNTFSGCVAGEAFPIDCLDTNSTYEFPVSVNYSTTESVVPGDEFSLMFYISINCTVLTAVTIDYTAKLSATESCNFSLKRVINEGENKHYALYAKEALARALQLSVKNDIISDTFSYDAITNTYGSSGNTVLCNGKMLRGTQAGGISEAPSSCFAGESVLINNGWNISFKTLFDNLSAVFCLGFEVLQDFVRVERKSYFYRNELILPRFIINARESKFSCEFTQANVFNSFEFGYSKYDTEYFSINEDVHTLRKFNNKLKTIENVFDKKCDFIASPFTTIRQIISDSPKYDDSNFIFQTWGAPQRTLIQNIPSFLPYEDVINYTITPKMNWQRWARYINNIKLQGEEASFTNGDGYTGASYIVPGTPPTIVQDVVGDRELYPIGVTTITENTSLPSEVNGIFNGLLYNFQISICFDDYKKIRDNKYGLIEARLDTDSTIIRGWINLLDYEPVSGLAKFTLIGSKQ